MTPTIPATTSRPDPPTYRRGDPLTVNTNGQEVIFWTYLLETIAHDGQVVTYDMTQVRPAAGAPQPATTDRGTIDQRHEDMAKVIAGVAFWALDDHLADDLVLAKIRARLREFATGPGAWLQLVDEHPAGAA